MIASFPGQPSKPAPKNKHHSWFPLHLKNVYGILFKCSQNYIP